MHISLSPPSSPSESRARRAQLQADLAWLREELGGAKTPEQKASVLYQIGVLEQLAGHDPVAVRQLLGAVNTVAHFKEPLERLIALVERRRSFKNLPTLLEHLCRFAEGDEEVARANVALAWYMLQHGRDEARALSHIEAALAAVPGDSAALLSLELVARRTGDGARTLRALEAQLERATEPTWAAVLGLELADAHVRGGQHEAANALLVTASGRASALAFTALEQRVALGKRAQRPDWTIDALDARAARIMAALGGSEGDGVAPLPRLVQTPANALAALLEKAELEQRAGRDAGALATLERAALLAPDHPVVTRRLLEHMERIGDAARTEAAYAAELASDPTSAEAAALWFGLGESRAARHDTAAALVAYEQTLSHDPASWLAHARRLELLREAGDVRGQARALEQIAGALGDGAARARYWLLAADAWARLAQLPDSARAALEQAEASGAPATLVRRTERALAHALGDRGWYDTATRRLLATDLDESERVGLELECWRQALLAGDTSNANDRLAALDVGSAGRRVARLARAYVPASETDHHGPAALERLLELDWQPARAAALGWALGLRHASLGERSAAIDALARAHTRHPAAAVIAGTLSAWLRDAGDARGAAAVLRGTAAALDESSFAASLYVEAGLACWWAGDRDAARRDFVAAERPFRGGRASTLAEWAQRGSAGFGSEPDVASDDPEERLLGALERATATATPGLKELNDLNLALRGLADAPGDALVIAAHLTALLLSRLLGVRVDPAALDRLAQHGPDVERLTREFRYLECIGQAEPSPRALEEATRRWSDADGGLVAALEWAAAGARLGQRRVECAARQRLASLLDADAAEHARASGALIAHLSQAEPAPFLEGASPVSVLTNLETSPPGSDPRRRAHALEDAGDVLGEEAEPMLCLLRGYNQLATADAEAAIGSFRRYTDVYPEDPSGWEGLLSAARHVDDPALLAEAASTLGSTCRDPAHAARLFEEAAEIFFTRLGDDVAGQAALSRAVELDVSRSSSFARLFQTARDTFPPAERAALIERRLPHASGAPERVDLEWELARARREQGNLEGALAALHVVTEHDPDHLGALTLTSEILVTLRRYGEAVDLLSRISERPDAPAAQRLTSGLAAVDLCENHLGSTERALTILSSLERAGLSTLGVRERLARSAAKTGAWEEAASMFERLMFERDTSRERAEAARLALAIRRDKLRDPRAAGPAARVLLGFLPDDAEALDLALSGSLEQSLERELLEAGRRALVQSTAIVPTDAEALQRLNRIAEHLGDMQLRQSTLGALVALGQGPSESRAELVSLERRISTIPPAPVSNDVLAGLADPEDRGPVPDLLSLVAPHLAETFGPPRQAFQVSRRERVAADAPLYAEVAAWVSAFGLSHFELYSSPVPSERLVVLGTEPLMIVAGASVTPPLGPFQRQALARSLYALKRGLSPLLQLEEADVHALIAALCSIAKVALSGPAHARQRDFERQIVKALPRKTRKLLPERARPVRDAEANLDNWVRAATASLDRVAAVAVGDASIILADAGAREAGAARRDERARRLLRFVLSPEFMRLRQRFGVTVR